MQQEGGNARDSSTQARTIAAQTPSIMPQASTLNAAPAEKDDVFLVANRWPPGPGNWL
jgi:hypothetical protein